MREVSINKDILSMMTICLSVAVILGCTLGDSAPAATPKVVEIEVEKIVEVEKDPGKLTIYSGRGESLVDPIIQQFGEVTGIDVQVKYAKTSELAATLAEEGSKTPADVFFAQDPGGLGSVEDSFTVLPDSILALVPAASRGEDGRWVGISGRARTVVYNNEKLTEADLPDDMFGFLDPKWEGRIGWAPTNSSFQTMVTAMREVWGEDRTREWLVGIQANNPKMYPKNTPQVAAAAAGEIDVGFVNHYYLFRFLAEEGDSFSARNYHLRSGGPGAVVMVSGVGILSSSDNQENAQKFVEFMLSKVAQQYFAGQTFEYPLVEGVKTSRLLTPMSDINLPNIDVNAMTDIEGTVGLLRGVGILP